MARRQRSGVGDLERAVLEVLWGLPDGERTTVREVHTALSGDRDIAYTTVMTVLERLARKEVVDQQRDGRAYTYRAAATRGEMTADMMRATLDDFGAVDRPAALVAFVEDASDAEVAALRAALARLDQ